MLVRWTLAAALGALCLSCGGTPQGLNGPSAVPALNRAEPFTGPDAVPSPVLPTEFLVAAGDIGQCGAGGNSEGTAKLLDAIAGTVVALGDNAYPSGTAQNYRDCYDPTWGRHKARTRPVPGNHEYDTAAATPYYDYFGGNAGPAGAGFYSYELGNWHVIALNSNIAAGGGSSQVPTGITRSSPRRSTATSSRCATSGASCTTAVRMSFSERTITCTSASPRRIRMARPIR